MSVRSLGYDNDDLDDIIRYFMKTILNLQKTGIEKLPLENDFQEPLKSFLACAMQLLIDGQLPEISRIILDSEYDLILNHGKLDIETIVNLKMIQELSWHIHFDDNYYDYILSTGNLWGNAALEYATLTFYPNLPAEIKEKHNIAELIKYVPKERFRLDDY